MQIRVKNKRPRDASPLASDIVYAIIDFAGDGRSAFAFLISLAGTQRDSTVVNENQFSNDWDAVWQSAIFETEETWQAEVLIPWSVANLPRACDTRTIGVNFGRFVDSLGVRYSYPAISFANARYLSDLARIEVANQRAGGLSVVPYVSVSSDFVGDQVRAKAGADVLWKPSAELQIAAAVNPDFGQVESDQLVVNFDAIEVFFSDRRPFFTENKSLFDVPTPQGGQLVYTRRVGDRSDDGSQGVSDIDGAIKLTGALGMLNYGALVAAEADSFGRDFAAARLQNNFTKGSIGYLGTLTDRPFLERLAMVHALDFKITPNASLLITGLGILSQIDQAQIEQNGTGGYLSMTYTPSLNWEFDLTGTHYGRDLALNDFGFQPRVDFNQIYSSATRRWPEFAAASAFAANSTSVIFSPRYNDRGDRLQSFGYLQNTLEFKGGGSWYSEIGYDGTGQDDLLTRGNGNVLRERTLSFWNYYDTPRLGGFKGQFGLWWLNEGLTKRALQLETDASFDISDAMVLQMRYYYRNSPDWLIWQVDSGLARFQRKLIDSELNLNWQAAAKHELRLKLQWFAIRAYAGQAYRVIDNARPLPESRAVPDFNINNFGLQLRYRWNFAPRSDLFIVYSRGGFEFDAASQNRDQRSVGNLFESALELRDADQFLVKLTYGF